MDIKLQPFSTKMMFFKRILMSYFSYLKKLQFAFWGLTSIQIKAILFALTIGILFNTGCQNNIEFKDKIIEISSAERSIKCELIEMKKTINQEWDSMNKSLNESLPLDMAAQEKSNMLKVRNASLIRMFESYKTVDFNVKDQLRLLEMKDSIMSKQINVLKEELIKVETKRMKLFNEINSTKGQAAMPIYKQLYQNALLKKCHS